MNVSQANALIIGGKPAGAANLASALPQAFLDNGWKDVYVTCRSDRDAEGLRCQGVIPVQTELTDTTLLAQKLKGLPGMNAVVLNAGTMAYRQLKDLYQVNALIPFHVMQALGLNENLPQNFVHVSSLMANPNTESRFVDHLLELESTGKGFDELYLGAEVLSSRRYLKRVFDTKWIGLPQHQSEYGLSKMLGEYMSLLGFLHLNGSRQGWVSVRPAMIMSTQDGPTRELIQGLKTGVYPDFSRVEGAKTSFVTAEDAARVIEHIARKQLENPRYGVFYVDNGEGGFTADELVGIGKDVFDKKLLFALKNPLLTSLILYAGVVRDSALRLLGKPGLMDLSRIDELQHNSFKISNHDLYAAFPGLQDDVDFTTLREFLQQVREAA